MDHFGRKHKPARGKRPQHGRGNSKHGGGTSYSLCFPKAKPYDICLCGSRRSATISIGSLNEMGHTEMEGAKQRVLRPGMVLLKHYITYKEQVVFTAMP